MDWFFLGLVILGSILGQAKKSDKILGQHIIQEVNHASTELADIMASMKGEMK